MKTPVVALVERKGRAVCFPVERVDGHTLQSAIRKMTRPKTTHMMSDDLNAYHALDRGFAGHGTVKHSAGEYVRDDVHTNSVEGFFSLLKRAIIGTFHHVSKGHLHRYCDEAAFRYTHRTALGVSDEQRAQLLVLGAEGKRLTYKQPSGNRGVIANVYLAARGTRVRVQVRTTRNRNAKGRPSGRANRPFRSTKTEPACHRGGGRANLGVSRDTDILPSWLGCLVETEGFAPSPFWVQSPTGALRSPQRLHGGQ